MYSPTNQTDLQTLIAVIAHSQIIVAERAGDVQRLPSGFENVDINVLEWIAAEGRRAPGRALARM